MLRQPTVSNPLERAQMEVSDEIDTAVAAIVAEMGAAPGARPVSDKEKVRLWGQTDPNVDFDQIKAALMQGGLPPEMLDEHNPKALAIVKANPEIAQMYGQQLDDRMSTIMATLAEYPLRLSTLEPHEDDPDEMVKEAERIDGLWQKSLGVTPAPKLQPATPSMDQQKPTMTPPVMPAMIGG